MNGSGGPQKLNYEPVQESEWRKPSRRFLIAMTAVAVINGVVGSLLLWQAYTSRYQGLIIRRNAWIVLLTGFFLLAWSTYLWWKRRYR